MPLPAVRPWRAAGFCVDWFAGRFVGLSVGWFVGLLVCWFVGLLVCWFVGLLVCCLVDWFAGVGWLCRLWLVACFAFQFGRICNPGAFFSRFVICHALRYRVLAICCQPRRSSASGSKNHSAALCCRQADSAAAGFCVSAWLTLVFQRGYLLCSGVICNPPERRVQ